jgi:hypothetical protein
MSEETPTTHLKDYVAFPYDIENVRPRSPPAQPFLRFPTGKN